MKTLAFITIALAGLWTPHTAFAGGIPAAATIIAFANDPAVAIPPSAGVVVDVKEAKILEFLTKGHEVPCHRDWYYNDFEGDLSAPAGTHGSIASRIEGGDFVCAQGGVIASTDGKVWFWKLQEDGLITFSQQGAKDFGFFRLQCDEAAATMPATLSFRPPATTTCNSRLAPPDVQDVIAFANRPAMPERFKARYLVDEQTVLKILAHHQISAESSTTGKPGGPLRDLSARYGALPDAEKKKVRIIDTSGTFTSRDLQPTTAIEADGVLVTRQHQVYFWTLLAPGLLYLTGEKSGNCTLKM